MRKVTIKTEYISLDALLKYADIFSSGGMTKILLNEGNVFVNNQPVHERRKKIYPGDRVFVHWPDEELEIELSVERK